MSTAPKPVKTKVLHLTYDMRIGGTEMVIKNLVEGIDEEKFEVEILCIQPNLGPFGQQLLEQGVKISNLSWLGGFDLSLIKSIRKYLNERHVDIVHCHQYSPWVYGTVAAAFTRTKVIFTEHGRFYPDSSSWKRRLINPILLAFTDAVTAISKATKQALADFEYIPLEKTQVVYNGIRPLAVTEAAGKALRMEHGLLPEDVVLGTVARLDPIKNQTMMLRAFAKVLRGCPTAKLMIVGDGEEKAMLTTLVQELDIRESVVFTGYIANPADHINLIDLFLLSSLSEGTSMTLLEAMSLGKVCVVTDAGGNPEIIEHQSNGLVTPNDDADAFADAIVTLLSDANLLHRQSKAAKARFDEYFNQKVMNQAYQHIYQDVQ